MFYLSNRAEKERVGTLENLKKFGFPNADDAHLILKTDVSSKEGRRQKITETYDVLLLIGDNLADFSSLFDKKTTAERTQNVQSIAYEFGKNLLFCPMQIMAIGKAHCISMITKEHLHKEILF